MNSADASLHGMTGVHMPVVLCCTWLALSRRLTLQKTLLKHAYGLQAWHITANSSKLGKTI